MATIRIAGIDPALNNLGLALATVDVHTLQWQVISVKLIQTEKGADGKVVRKSSDDLARAKHLHVEMHKFLGEWGAQMVVSEVPTGTQSARGSFSNGLCCGLLGSIERPMIEVSPTEVKLASAGHKYATKEEMIQWAVATWPDLPWLSRKFKGAIKLVNDNEHMADACGAIAAGLKTQQFRQAVELYRAAVPLAA